MVGWSRANGEKERTRWKEWGLGSTSEERTNKQKGRKAYRGAEVEMKKWAVGKMPGVVQYYLPASEVSCESMFVFSCP